MSITGISAGSSAAYLEQVRNASTSPTAPRATAVQTTSGTQASSTDQQAGRVHRHHHGGGDLAAQAIGLAQSGTAAAAGTNILNTLV